jgi:hypothetical protein
VPVKAAPLVQHPYLWGLGLGSFTLGLVNGALVVSAGLGWVAYKQLQALSPRQWAVLKQRVEQVLPLPRSLRHQALVLSVLLGTSTYTVTSLWQATHSILMALLLLGQTTLTFFMVGVLLRSGKTAPKGIEPEHASAKRPALAPPTPGSPALDLVEQELGQLSHPDPLKRLVAVRRLVKLVDGMGEDRPYAAGAKVSLRSHLLDCFHIMLAHESEPIVRTAVREGLHLLRQTHQLPEGPPPLPNRQEIASYQDAKSQDSLSQDGNPLGRQGHRATVEYVEYLEP